MADPTALLRSATPQLWLNPHRAVPGAAPASVDGIALGRADMQGAQDRFTRFAPLLAELFPELAAHQGQIESALTPVPRMQQALGLPPEHGRLWVKADHSLPVAGSIKARGGFHEVLEWAEKLAVQHGLRLRGPHRIDSGTAFVEDAALPLHGRRDHLRMGGGQPPAATNC